jgi:hypothetical protein
MPADSQQDRDEHFDAMIGYMTKRAGRGGLAGRRDL